VTLTAWWLQNIFGKASAAQQTAEDAKTSTPASKSPGAAASKEDKSAALLNSTAGSRTSKILQQVKAQVVGRNAARKADFMDTMSKIGSKGKPLSPRSQRLLGGLSGDKYKDLKAEHIPSEREKQRLAAKAKKAKEEAENAGEDEDDFNLDPNLASPNTIIRRAKKAPEASKATMAQVNEILSQSSKLIANQFKGMSERRLKERIKISLDTYDTSKDGLLQADEVQKALTGLGQTLTMEQAHEFIRTNAQDHNPDALTLDDFERVVRLMLFGSEAGISRVQSSDTSEAASIIEVQEDAGPAASQGS
jgi:Ca2+-binding EF-hand superfamily protein